MADERPLHEELQSSKPIASPRVEAYLNLQRTQDVLHTGISRLLKIHGVSQPQYNVLRILRGAGEDGLACRRIGERMVKRVPDVTRLLDRLEAATLVQRSRCDEDRRVVVARISAEGLALLAELDQPLEALHEAQLAHLTTSELKTLNRLLVKARANVGEDS